MIGQPRDLRVTELDHRGPTLAQLGNIHREEPALHASRERR
jgi:hypothetical protein